MSKHEDHPFLQEIKRYAGSDNDELMQQTAIVNFATFDQSSRTHLLIETENIIGADDGVGLRQKAQLFNLSRDLRDLDRKMRAAGR